ncbi:c-type cytochrome [Asticcacaulis benevestitus]|uniref:Cytochrome c domain-containing protein n=1 Tax=Asticcacaulis benevestitus DSM 16100 = ATCC BAA-896 TaxID=1121022 RepID=V4PNH6_9CAUL|nr:c-type cytochrome [Asticcacaulis benevestitus]ESQ88854.1 hypothetical protein ABENE_15200 [Asticcacaulis benevestitus DSM 16100 = ATCC BAA-896]
MVVRLKAHVITGCLVAALMTHVFGAQAQPLPEQGAQIFSQKCALCHDNSQYMINDNGPALFGVVGRRVGSIEGYAYSPALTAAAARGDTWTVTRLKKFLSGPEAMYPGTGMPMHFETPNARAAITAYLKTLTPRK